MEETKMSIYICGDIHGQYGLYEKMLEGIRFGADDRLYVIGDMIDRGPDGIKILQDVRKRENVVCLLGNHELMMYDYVTGTGETGEAWSMPNNGGTVSRTAFYRLPAEEQREITAFLGELPLQVELEAGGRTWLLSHSSFLEDQGTVKWREIPGGDVFDVVWNSPWRFWEYIPIERYQEDGRFHIIGHVPVQRLGAGEWPEHRVPAMPAAFVDQKHHVANIDLGCAGYDLRMRGGTYSLCCMNLTEFAEGDPEKAFTYYF